MYIQAAYGDVAGVRKNLVASDWYYMSPSGFVHAVIRSKKQNLTDNELIPNDQFNYEHPTLTRTQLNMLKKIGHSLEKHHAASVYAEFTIPTGSTPKIITAHPCKPAVTAKAHIPALSLSPLYLDKAGKEKINLLRKKLKCLPYTMKQRKQYYHRPLATFLHELKNTSNAHTALVALDQILCHVYSTRECAQQKQKNQTFFEQVQTCIQQIITLGSHTSPARSSGQLTVIFKNALICAAEIEPLLTLPPHDPYRAYAISFLQTLLSQKSLPDIVDAFSYPQLAPRFSCAPIPLDIEPESTYTTTSFPLDEPSKDFLTELHYKKDRLNTYTVTQWTTPHAFHIDWPSFKQELVQFFSYDKVSPGKRIRQLRPAWYHFSNTYVHVSPRGQKTAHALMQELVDTINTAIITIQNSTNFSLHQKNECLHELHDALYCLTSEWALLLPKPEKKQIKQNCIRTNPTLIQQTLQSVLTTINHQLPAPEEL